MKTGIKIFFEGILICLISFRAYSQSGIYVETADYLNNKLSYERPCSKRHHQGLRLHNFFGNGSRVVIIDNGKKIHLEKDRLYGYRNCNGDIYRFYKHTEYRIAEAGNIYVYTRAVNIAQSKGYKVVHVYYFSVSPDEDIMPLTLQRLRKAYEGNDKFLDLLDQVFSGNEVFEYDNIHKSFKINYVYKRAIN